MPRLCGCKTRRDATAGSIAARRSVAVAITGMMPQAHSPGETGRGFPAARPPGTLPRILAAGLPKAPIEDSMKLRRRSFLQLTAGAATLAALPHSARAQAWPARAVHFVVGFPAGGGADATTRILAARLSELWGQQVVVENRGGA